MTTRQHIHFHLGIGLPCYALCAAADIYLTLHGLQGDPAREGNPLLRQMMQEYGLLTGMLLTKGAILVLLTLLAVFGAKGVEKDAGWLYWFTLPMTKRWMKQKKRYWIPFVPIYLVALSQAMAAASWYYLLYHYS